jgi:hypothetical protein
MNKIDRIKKKKIKQLKKYYNKLLLKQHKENFNSMNSSLDYFYTYIMYMRDVLLLQSADPEKDTTINSMTLALNSFSEYCSCIYKYYTIENGVAVARTDLDLNKEEIAKKYAEEREKNWNTFWLIISSCMEGWFE